MCITRHDTSRVSQKGNNKLISIEYSCRAVSRTSSSHNGCPTVNRCLAKINQNYTRLVSLFLSLLSVNHQSTTNQPTMNACLLTRDITRAPGPVPDAKEFLDLPKEGELYDAKTSQEKKMRGPSFAREMSSSANVLVRPC